MNVLCKHYLKIVKSIQIAKTRKLLTFYELNNTLTRWFLPTLCASRWSRSSARQQTPWILWPALRERCRLGMSLPRGRNILSQTKIWWIWLRKFAQKKSQSGESFCLQVVTHSKKCSVYFIDKDSAEARWVGPKKKTPANTHTLHEVGPVAKVWSYPTQSVPESSRFAFGSGLGILIGSLGGHWGVTSHRLLQLRLPGRIAEFVKDVFPAQRRSESYPENMRISDIFQGTKQCLVKVHLYKPLSKKKRQEYSEIGSIFLQFYVGIHLWPLWFSLFLQAPGLSD